MFDYSNLNATRREFIDAAFSLLDLNDTITSNQIDKVIEHSKLKYPQWLIVPENRIDRALYKFPRPTTATPKPVETDEQISVRIADRYESMETLIEAVSANAVNSLIVAGAPGLGKSYTVNKVLSKINAGEYGYVFHRGYIRATHLFRLLWENRNPGQTIVIDDCDSIFSDETALNLLKAALEMKPTRRIGWGSEKEFTDEDGEVIPRYFDFEGSVIFLTNLAFHDMIEAGTKYAPHLSALESRSLVLDLGIKTKKEYLIKIRQTVESGMLRDKGISKTEEEEIMNFVEANVDNLRELSLRMVEKIAALYLLNEDNWEKLARTVCCK